MTPPMMALASPADMPRLRSRQLLVGQTYHGQLNGCRGAPDKYTQPDRSCEDAAHHFCHRLFRKLRPVLSGAGRAPPR